MRGEATTIMVLRDTRERLKEYGQKGETYDEIIERLLEHAQKCAFQKRIRQIFETEEFVPLGKV